MYSEYNQIVMQNGEFSLKDFLISFKFLFILYDPEGRLFNDPHKLFFGNQIFLPEYSDRMKFIPDFFQKEYSFKFDEILSQEILHHVYKLALQENGWIDLEFIGKEYKIIYEIFNSIMYKDINISHAIFHCNSLPILHSYLSFVKYSHLYSIVDIYKKAEDNDTERNLDRIINTLISGKIPLLSKHIGKKQDEYETESQIYGEIQLIMAENIKHLKHYIENLFANDNLIENLIPNTINFEKLFHFLLEFKSQYYPIFNFFILRFDEIFVNSPSFLECFNDGNIFFLMKYLYFLFITQKKEKNSFSNYFFKYKALLKEIMEYEGASSIRSILFQGFSLEFVEFLLRELEEEIIDLIEQSNPFWNLGLFSAESDPAYKKFLEIFKDELTEAYNRPRIDHFYL
jgi:hypothetical protein